MGRYDEAVDNISAYEALTDTIEHEAKAQQLAAERAPAGEGQGSFGEAAGKASGICCEAETEGMGSRSEKEGKSSGTQTGPD